MNDEKLREAYERGLSGGGVQPPLDDLAAERLRRLVEREGSEAERLHTIEELLSTAEGRQDLEIAWAASRAASPRPSAIPAWARAAAGLLLVVGATATWMVTRPEGNVVRGESPVQLVTPLGEQSIDRARRFAWRPVDGAVTYQLVLVDSAGADVFATETADTAVTLPDSVRLNATTYLWWVQARKPLGEVVTAVTERLMVRP